MFYKLSFVILCVLFPVTSAFGFVQERKDSTRENVSDPRLREELLTMHKQDQNIRRMLLTKSFKHALDSTDYARQDSIDDKNTNRLKEIVLAQGWPGKKKVGTDGANGAFVVLQHSRDTLFQQACVPLLEKAFKAGDIPGSHVALLTDRVLTHQGKPQIYGSQVSIAGGTLVVFPIADSVNVDARRAEVGLQPMSEYLKMLKDTYLLK